jgi:hypothetical protein
MRKTIKFLSTLVTSVSVALFCILLPAHATEFNRDTFTVDAAEVSAEKDISQLSVFRDDEVRHSIFIEVTFSRVVGAANFCGGRDVDVYLDTDDDEKRDLSFSIYDFSPCLSTEFNSDIRNEDFDQTGCDANGLVFPSETKSILLLSVPTFCDENHYYGISDEFSLRVFHFQKESFQAVPEGYWYVQSPSETGKAQTSEGYAGILGAEKGPIRVGMLLTAESADWDRGTTLAFKWGAFVPNMNLFRARENGSAAKYRVTLEDAGKELILQICSRKAGFKTVCAYSMSSEISKGLLLKKPVPTVSGASKTGQTLSAKVGTWDSGVKLAYQWLRNGVAIKGATKATYKLAAADKGKKISVKVTGTKPGYVTVAKTSATKTISK